MRFLCCILSFVIWNEGTADSHWSKFYEIESVTAPGDSLTMTKAISSLSVLACVLYYDNLGKYFLCVKTGEEIRCYKTRFSHTDDFLHVKPLEKIVLKSSDLTYPNRFDGYDCKDTNYAGLNCNICKLSLVTISFEICVTTFIVNF